MTTNLYRLNPEPVKQIDRWNATFELHNSQRPDTVICHVLLPNNDVNFWNKLLRAQAAKAWEEGYQAEDASIDDNPYTVKAQVNGL